MEWIHLWPHLFELEYLIEIFFHGFFHEKETSWGIPGGFVIETKLRSTSSALLNFPEEIIRITSKDNENLEICLFLKTRY